MIKKIIYISLIWMVFHGASLHAASLLVEAESFTEKGGWVVDQQFMDLMGSPYLLAHGLGSPVENASTNVQLPENGTYYIFLYAPTTGRLHGRRVKGPDCSVCQ